MDNASGSSEETSGAPAGSTGRVVAGVLAGPREGELLVFRRAPGRSHAGLWEFPGGKVEPGESEEVALTRELREELSITVSVGRRLWSGVRSEPPPLEIIFYEVMIEAGELKLHDHDGLEVISPSEGSALPLAEVDALFLSWCARVHPDQGPHPAR